jgi:hypothetical protein
LLRRNDRSRVVGVGQGLHLVRADAEADGHSLVRVGEIAEHDQAARHVAEVVDRASHWPGAGAEGHGVAGLRQDDGLAVGAALRERAAVAVLAPIDGVVVALRQCPLPRTGLETHDWPGVMAASPMPCSIEMAVGRQDLRLGDAEGGHRWDSIEVRHSEAGRGLVFEDKRSSATSHPRSSRSLGPTLAEAVLELPPGTNPDGERRG